MRRWIVAAAVLLAFTATAFFVSPWPSVLIIRAMFDSGAAEASRKLEPHLPQGVTTTSHR